MNYSLKILPRAECDFRQIFSFIKHRSPDGAGRWKQAFAAGVARLRENPLAFGLAPEDGHFEFELRQLLFKTRRGRAYRAVFRIDGDKVVIFRIRGAGQAPLGHDDLPLE